MKLQDIFDLIPGFAFKSADFVESGVPALKIKNVKANAINLERLSYVDEKYTVLKKDKLIRFSDLLITMSGNRFGSSTETWVGKVAQFRLNGLFLLNQRVGILRAKTGAKVDERFCAFVLSSMPYQEHLVQIGTSSGGQANLSPKQILDVEIGLPCLEEQIAIAELLGSMDDRIASLAGASSSVETITRAIFKSWFVDFDPVRAKAEGREPEGMDAATAALFPDTLEEVGNSVVPNGWGLQNLSSFAEVCGGKQLSKDFFEPGGLVPVFGGNGVMGWTQQSNAVPFTINVGRVGAYCGNFYWSAKPSWINNNASSISLRDPTNFSFLLLALKFADVATIRRGAAQPFVSNGDLKLLPIIYPPGRVRERFESITKPLLIKLAASEEQAKALAELRDTLILRLISGKLRVPEAEKLVGAVL